MDTAGIDIGSITAKAALFRNGKIAATKLIFTGYNSEAAGEKLFAEILRDAGIAGAEKFKIVATGYGRASVSFADKAITEISCHAAGARYLNDKIRFIIDIGGQDSKAILLDEQGKVKNFVMNDKCAAGTGRFLEVMARALEINLDEFGTISGQAKNPSPISSLCTVFAESEVISLIAKGMAREDIIAGIHESIGARVAALAARAGLAKPAMITGGVAKNAGVVKALEKALGLTLEVSPHAQFAGAIGAAILAQNLS
ncbi:MAG TPA: acyl-CoA dehydratase activase [Smithellaceae bacterium]|nr:acyl-CoA dehydratase activase [Smithellaceae bacterium]